MPKLTPLKAIRKMCYEECQASSRKGVRNCARKTCPLWEFRMGTNPNRKKTLSEEQRQELVDRARVFHERRKKEVEEEKTPKKNK